MYTYPASSTGFDAAFPLWIQDGGLEAWVERLKDPKQRARAFAEMHRPDASENSKLVVDEPDKVLLVGFKTEALKPLTGKSLGEVAKARGKSAEETAADLIVEDGTRIQVVYFGMSEANVAREVALPWMSFGSDAAANRRRIVRRGWRRYVGAVGVVGAMAHHPSGAHPGALGGIVHGAMIALSLLLAWGFAHFAIGRGASRPLIVGGLLAYAVSLFGNIGAATINGFVVPALADPAAATAGRPRHSSASPGTPTRRWPRSARNS